VAIKAPTLTKPRDSVAVVQFDKDRKFLGPTYGWVPDFAAQIIAMSFDCNLSNSVHQPA
jgi:hypothetical protein